ncbi:MAG: 2-oxo acid dehydrogenase subunit E2, partial [Candidatus Dormibacteraeota bacterium]|nr:2-oxo acid dehydrogenase subunit E2 [Candidatus Dormibacteraeota bacterium]
QPQAAILVMDAVIKRPVVVGDAIAIRPMMNLCLSFDHRINDGSAAALFLGAVKAWLESVTAETAIY